MKFRKKSGIAQNQKKSGIFRKIRKCLTDWQPWILTILIFTHGTRNFCKFFHGSNFYQKFTFSKVYFYKYERLKRFVWKDDHVFVNKRKIGNHFPNRRWYVPSVDARWHKNESVNTYFVNVNLLLTAETSWLSPFSTECWPTLSRMIYSIEKL